MPKKRVKQSNPFSTGGGGTNFEISVQTYFSACMLMGWKIPGLKEADIKKMKLQGRYEGFNTDDCIIYGKNGGKLLCQIKHTIAITEGDSTFKEVMEAAWNDFDNKDLFDKDNDRIALVTAGLSATDIKNTKYIFQWARACNDKDEFLHKMYLPNFSSKEKQNKYEIIKEHLKRANSGIISDDEVWQFLKHFNILILELDVPDSAISLAITEGIDQFAHKDNFGAELYRYIADLNQNAGTVTAEKIASDLNWKTNVAGIGKKMGVYMESECGMEIMQDVVDSSEEGKNKNSEEKGSVINQIANNPFVFHFIQNGNNNTQIGYVDKYEKK